MQYSRTSNVIRNSGASLLYKFVQIIVQFALRTVFIRVLGKEYTGISTLFTDILQVLSLMDLALPTAMAYALYKPVAEDDTRKINALMNFYKKAYTIIGVLVFGVGISLTPLLGYLVKDVPNIREDIRLIYAIYVLTTASSYFLIYKTIVFRARQESRIISLIRVVAYIIEGIVEIVLLVIFRQYFCYLITHFVFTFGANVILSYTAEKRNKSYFSDKSVRLENHETRKMFKDVFALAIYKISGVIIYSTDSIVISAFIGTQQVAVIGNFNLIINGLRTAVEQVVDSVKSGVGNLAATSTTEKQEQIFKRMNFIAFWVACFSSTCLFTLLNPFVGEVWFNSSYMVSQSIVAVLSLNFYIAVMVYPVESFRTANGLFIQGKYRPAIMAAMNIILDVVFVRYWGIFGVLIATTISRLSTQAWFDPYLVYKHVFKKKVAGYLVDYYAKLGITVLSCIISTLAVNSVHIANAYIGFLVKAVISALLSNLIVVGLYCKTDEFRSVLQIGKKMMRRLKR